MFIRHVFSRSARRFCSVSVVREAANDAELESLRKSGPMLTNFSAAWCGPCVRSAPELDKLATEFPAVHFARVDIDNTDLEQTVAASGIRAVPTYIISKPPGEEVGRVQGADLQAVRALLEKV
eukprot:CAMPEP_0170146350 /NCGR_PEP_ID=MMETSP0033_2-20121228/29826_1 /TAXON_ID=195969 /ORGANISM="Dolichomastix tenuilepis, Strain CCMP3274" /LENGTH=122 /DNA_ID=CAMNT_0010383069 /DNA_START=80 /DNA_END=448 /DNA_ORIENTATION=-